MNRPTKLRAVLAVASALFAAGCGDDDDHTSSPATTTPATGATSAAGETLNKDQFIAQADAICATGDEAIEAAAGQFGGEAPQGQELVGFSTDVVIPSIQGQLDGIAALPVPEGEEEDAVDELLTELQAAIDALEEDPALIAEGEGPFREVNQLAEDFGLTNCGGG